MSVDGAVRRRLEMVGLTLPSPRIPTSAYLPARRHGDLVYCAGVTSAAGGGPVASDEDVDAGRQSARDAALQQLASIENELGSLDTVAMVLRLTGYVCCVGSFARCPDVIDAASEVFIAAFGDLGRHARSAIGVAALPGNATVELEALLAVRAT